MCYYSAEGHSRAACQDEVLVVQRQRHGRNWLVSPDDPSTAVCLPDGAEVELLYIPEDTRRQFGLAEEAVGRFKMRHWWRRDILVIGNGAKVPLQQLQPHQVVRLLSLGKGCAEEQLSLDKSRSESSVTVG
jgi:hypothetical protein